MDFAGAGSGTFFSESRAAGMDAAVGDIVVRNCAAGVEEVGGWCAPGSGESLVLPVFRAVSGLGGDFFVWQPIFRFVNGNFHNWVRSCAGTIRQDVPPGTHCGNGVFDNSGSFCAMESWVDLPVGDAFDSSPRGDFFPRSCL